MRRLGSGSFGSSSFSLFFHPFRHIGNNNNDDDSDERRGTRFALICPGFGFRVTAESDAWGAKSRQLCGWAPHNNKGAAKTVSHSQVERLRAFIGPTLEALREYLSRRRTASFAHYHMARAKPEAPTTLVKAD